MSSIDAAHEERRAEKKSMRTQGFRDIKSKIKFRKCKTPGCAAVITHAGDYCHNCLRGMDAYSKKVRNLQSMMCNSGIVCDKKTITGGTTCRACMAAIARLRRNRMKVNPYNWERIREHIRMTDRNRVGLYHHPELEGRVERTTPQRFDTNPYKIDRKIERHTAQLTMPQLRARRV